MSGLNPDLRATTDIKQRQFTGRQLQAIQAVRDITPKAFLRNAAEGFPTDVRLLGMFGLSVLDVTTTQPRENFTTENYPLSLQPLLVYGTEKYILLFMAAKYALIDISYSDAGLSINLDRVSKIKTVHDMFKEDWQNVLGNYKKGVLLSQSGLGLATPRFQGTLSRMVGMLGDGAFGWQIP